MILTSKMRMWILAGLLGLLSANFITAEAITSSPGINFASGVYLNPNTGRFWTMDSYEGSQSDPLSLHKYLYAQANPKNGSDPSGHDFVSTLSSMYIYVQTAAMSLAATASTHAWVMTSIVISMAQMQDQWNQGEYVAAGVTGFFMILPGGSGVRVLPQYASRHLIRTWIKSLASEHTGATEQAMVEALKIGYEVERHSVIVGGKGGVQGGILGKSADIMCDVWDKGVKKRFRREVRVVSENLSGLYGKISAKSAQLTDGEIKEVFVQIGDKLKSDPNWKQRVVEAGVNAEKYFADGTKVTIVDSAGVYIY